MKIYSTVDRTIFLSLIFALSLLTFRNIYFTACWPANIMDFHSWFDCEGGSLIFFVWNIFLATLPYFFARIFLHTSRTLFKTTFFLLWLLFLPNAPYLITDLIHLRPRDPIPFQFDIVLFFCFSWTGLLLGARSLAIISQSLFRKLDSPFYNVAMYTTLLLAGIGIYIGRYLRWNSWDIFTRPVLVIEDSLASISSTKALFTILGYSMLLGLAYRLIPVFNPDKSIQEPNLSTPAIGAEID